MSETLILEDRDTAQEIVGAWVRENRVRLGLTQKELGFDVRLDQSEISQTEKGRRPVRPLELARLIVRFGTMPDWEAVAKGLYLTESFIELPDLG